MKNNTFTKTKLKKAIHAAGFNTDFGDGYLNIFRDDGVNCEFYTCMNEWDYLTARYTVRGKERDLDYWFPNDLDLFIADLKEILS